MIIDTNIIPEVVRENAYGAGHCVASDVGRAPMARKITLCNRLRLEPGSEIGEHAHVDDFELYYIISGTGVVNDTQEEKAVGPGFLFIPPTVPVTVYLIPATKSWNCWQLLLKINAAIGPNR